MRSRGTPRRPHGANEIPNLQFVPDGHAHLTQVQERGGQAIPVVQDHRSAGVKEIILGQGDPPRRRCVNGRPGRDRHVDTVVRASGCPVVNPLTAIDTGYPAGHGPDETGRDLLQPVGPLDALGLCGPHQGPLAPDALQLLLGRRHRALGHSLNPRDPIVPLSDGQWEDAAIAYLQYALGRGIAMKGREEETVRKDVQSVAIQAYARAGLDPPPDETTLGQVSLDVEAGSGGQARQQSGEDRKGWQKEKAWQHGASLGARDRIGQWLRCHPGPGKPGAAGYNPRMGRYRPPREKGTALITAEGEARLRAEVERLWREERPVVARAVQDAAKNGDRSENGDYIYGKKRLREIDSRVRFLTKRLETLKVIRERPSDPARIFFGAQVRLLEEDGTERELRIVGPDEFDPARGEISIDAPLARALLGKRPDDVARVESPTGVREVEILEIRYP